MISDKYFTRETVADIIDYSINYKLKKHLTSESDYVRSRAAIAIGLRLEENYAKLSDLLLNEMISDIHFMNIRFGIKSAWIIAMSLAENLREEDYPKLQEAFQKWNREEREGLIEYLKDLPTHVKILTGED